MRTWRHTMEQRRPGCGRHPYRLQELNLGEGELRNSMAGPLCVGASGRMALPGCCENFHGGTVARGKQLENAVYCQRCRDHCRHSQQQSRGKSSRNPRL